MSNNNNAMQQFVGNAPDALVTKREAELRRIEPDVRKIVTSLFPNEVNRAALGADTFEEWFFALNELQREQFVADSWMGDPGMLLRPIRRHIEKHLDDAANGSIMLRGVRQIVSEADSKDSSNEWRKRRESGSETVEDQMLVLFKRDHRIIDMKASEIAAILDCGETAVKKSSNQVWQMIMQMRRERREARKE